MFARANAVRLTFRASPCSGLSHARSPSQAETAFSGGLLDTHCYCCIQRVLGTRPRLGRTKALIKFADALAAFPIAAEHAPELLAGSVRDGKLLEAGYDFVRIAIRPLTAKGLLLALIGLGEITSDPTNADRHANSWDRVRSSLLDQPAPYFPYYQAIGVAFPTDYQSIANFASALRGIASGNAEEATLGAAVL
jgi:hypothetical protein